MNFPKTFCISLKENFLRKLHIEHHLKSNQIDFEFFDGCHSYKGVTADFLNVSFFIRRRNNRIS